jgi:hypothetical protein
MGRDLGPNPARYNGSCRPGTKLFRTVPCLGRAFFPCFGPAHQARPKCTPIVRGVRRGSSSWLRPFLLATRGGVTRVRTKKLTGDEGNGCSRGLRAAGMIWEDGEGCGKSDGGGWPGVGAPEDEGSQWGGLTVALRNFDEQSHRIGSKGGEWRGKGRPLTSVWYSWSPKRRQWHDITLGRWRWLQYCRGNGGERGHGKLEEERGIGGEFRAAGTEAKFTMAREMIGARQRWWNDFVTAAALLRAGWGKMGRARSGGSRIWGPYMKVGRGAWDAGHRVRAVVIRVKRARRLRLGRPLRSRRLRVRGWGWQVGLGGQREKWESARPSERVAEGGTPTGRTPGAERREGARMSAAEGSAGSTKGLVGSNSNMPLTQTYATNKYKSWDSALCNISYFLRVLSTRKLIHPQLKQWLFLKEKEMG